MTRMSLLSITLALLALPLGLHAQGPFASSVSSQQAAEQLTKQLVVDVLDLQLSHLEQNNLQDSPIHVQISTMRGQLDALVATEMRQITAILKQAEAATGSARIELRQQATRAARDVVRRLMEQQNELKSRLAVLELSADINGVLVAQQKVIAQTKRASKLNGVDRELQAIKLGDAQRGVETLAAALTTNLRRVAQQSGAPSDTAKSLLEAWRQAEVAQHFRDAKRFLDLGNATDSLNHQQQIAAALQAGLKETRAEQPSAPTASPVARNVNELIDRQQALREQVARGLPDEEAVDRATREQGELTGDIAKLRESLGEDPGARERIKQAQSHSEVAAEALFNQDFPRASEEQAAALAELRDVANGLEAGNPSNQVTAKSSQEFKQDAADSKKLADYLQRLGDLREQVATDNPDDPNAIAEADAFVADKLKKVRGARQWEPPLGEALQRAEQALQAAGAATPDAAPEETAQASTQLAAAQQAAADAEEDAERKAAGARFGELSRAADALDRATAVEQQIADRSTEETWSTESLDESARRQATIRAIADQVSKSLENDAPKIATEMQAAGDTVGQLGQQLRAASEEASQGGEASPDSKQGVTQTAATAASQLGELAKKVRQQMHRAAGESKALSEKESQSLQRSAAAQHQALQELLAAKQQAKQSATGAEPSEANSPAAQQAKQQLDAAIGNYAAAQQAAGQLAAEIAGQPQVGEPSIQRALDQAGRLGSSPSAEQANDHGYVPADAAQTAQALAGQTNSPNPTQGQKGEPSKGTNGEATTGGDRPDGNQGSGEPTEPGESAESTKGQPGDAPGSGEGNGQPVASAAGERSAEELVRRNLERSAPWLLRLPPDVRDSIRSATRQPPPPGYERRLQRYFESLD